MKKLNRHFAAVVAGVAAFAAAMPATTAAADFREHRGVYISPYVSDWPSGPIVASNASTYQRILRQTLDSYKEGGVNVVYFAVRPFCDAAYKSAYEPWSEFISGVRGKEPPFDPLQFLIDEAHARGIEVYTWVNAYRYKRSGSYDKNDPRNYEVSHPDWLLVQPHETILNPGLEEVIQRVCDVTVDIVDNYDIDGFLFDDYYYTNGTPMELDADLYQAALDADSTIGTQLEWRVNNINTMIRRVSEVIKQHKDHVVFGTKPAGVASPPNVTTEYGLEPSPDIREQDWQYKGVAADPLNWYKNHYSDFMAPQIYWCDLFDPLQEWWVKASRKFNRHLYSAVSMADFSKFGAAEFPREVEFSRDLQPDNVNGIGFFRMFYYSGCVGKLDNVTYKFPEYMGRTAFATTALAPIRPWNNVYEPAYVENLRREGSTLVWDEVKGMRYTIYAFAPGEEVRPWNTSLVQVRYTNSFEIPDELSGMTFGVAVYDRYGNEYPMSTEGVALKEAVPVELTYPEDGAVAADLFDFTWKDNGCENVLEVATDPEFTDKVVQVPCSKPSMSSYIVFNLEDGKTYYWRVRSHGVNSRAGVSETRSFTASRIAVTGPVAGSREESNTPLLTCNPAYDGTVYTFEVSRYANFTRVDYTWETTEPSVQVEPYKLMNGFRYYLRVKATRNGRSSMSNVTTFWTVDAVPGKPAYVVPAAEGMTLHADQAIEVAPVEGVSSILVQIADNPEFSGRVYRITLPQGETQTALLGKVRITSRYLVDGETYYVRACSRYFTQANQSAETESDYVYTSFVYSATDGVYDLPAEGGEVTLSPEGILAMPVAGNAVAVYTPDGSCVLSIARAAAEADLSALAPGLYVVKVNGPSPATIKWIKK